jgi:hypothetical protein
MLTDGDLQWLALIIHTARRLALGAGLAVVMTWIFSVGV